MAFGEEVDAPTLVPAMTPSDLPARMHKLEHEVTALKRIVNELRAEIRKVHGEVS